MDPPIDAFDSAWQGSGISKPLVLRSHNCYIYCYKVTERRRIRYIAPSDPLCEKNQLDPLHEMICFLTRCPSYKYNPYKWPKKTIGNWGCFTPISEVIILLISGSGGSPGFFLVINLSNLKTPKRGNSLQNYLFLQAFKIPFKMGR